jgi:hypothetical protein
MVLGKKLLYVFLSLSQHYNKNELHLFGLIALAHARLVTSKGTNGTYIFLTDQSNGNALIRASDFFQEYRSTRSHINFNCRALRFSCTPPRGGGGGMDDVSM